MLLTRAFPTTLPPSWERDRDTTRTVPNQTLFGSCGPSVVLGTWALHKPRLGTTGSQLLLGSGPSKRTEVEEQAWPPEVGPAGSWLLRVRDTRGWLGWEAIPTNFGLPSITGVLCQVESEVGMPGEGPPPCHGRGNTSPLISILKRQLFTKVSRKGVLPFTRRGSGW